eukprot:c10338_g1_i3.p1 GENE.c10338_g1_i3~~c10338_g1_i3.p1  ORF type:complete len:188 (-),score=1.91 c10338_g1_i3:163-726(-)
MAGYPDNAPPSEDDGHDDVCAGCMLGGELLCCDSCSLVYHLHCLTPALLAPPIGAWSCPRCTAGPGLFPSMPRIKYESRSTEVASKADIESIELRLRAPAKRGREGRDYDEAGRPEKRRKHERRRFAYDNDPAMKQLAALRASLRFEVSEHRRERGELMQTVHDLSAQIQYLTDTISGIVSAAQASE